MLIFRKIIVLALVVTVVFSSGLKIVWAEEGDADEGNSEINTAAEKAQRLFGSRSGAVIRLNLNECVERALIYNPEMQVADYSIEAAEQKKVEVSKLGYPIVDYEYNLAPVPKDVGHAMTSFFSECMRGSTRAK